MSLPVEYTTEWVPAWRWFTFTGLDQPLALQSLSQGAVLSESEVTASCSLGHHERIPDPDCRCGYYAHAVRAAALRYWFNRSSALAQVELSGEILAHGDDDAIEGYRGEKMRVLGITLDATCRACGEPAVGYERHHYGLTGRCLACAASYEVDLLSRSDIAGLLGVEVETANLIQLQEDAIMQVAAHGVAVVRQRMTEQHMSIDDLTALWTNDAGALGCWLADILICGVKLAEAWQVLCHQSLPILDGALQPVLVRLRDSGWSGWDCERIERYWRSTCDMGQRWDAQAQILHQQMQEQGIDRIQLEEMFRNEPEALECWLGPLAKVCIWGEDAWELLTGRHFPRDSVAEQYRLRGVGNIMLGPTEPTWREAVAQYREAEQLAEQLRARASRQGLDVAALQQLQNTPVELAEWIVPLVLLLPDEYIAWYLLTGAEPEVGWGRLHLAADAARLHGDPIWAWRVVVQDTPLTFGEYWRLGTAAVCLTDVQARQVHEQLEDRWGSDSVLRRALADDDASTIEHEAARLLPVLTARRDLRTHWEVFHALRDTDRQTLEQYRAVVCQLYCALIEGFQDTIRNQDRGYWFEIAKEGKGVWFTRFACTQLGGDT